MGGAHRVTRVAGDLQNSSLLANDPLDARKPG